MGGPDHGEAVADASPRRRGRPPLALLAGVALGVVAALIVGEYPFTGATPYLAAALVPGIIGFAMVGICRTQPGRLWAATGVLGAASVGWAVWISTGRGVDPTPAAGWVAIALALAWPLVWAARTTRHRAPVSS